MSDAHRGELPTGTGSEREFAREFAALDAIFGFTEEFFAREGIPVEHRFPVNFAIEEIFTNMIKYNTGATRPIAVALERVGDTLKVTLADRDVAPFDVTKAAEPKTDLPIEQRTPGGLGLHLTRRLMDRVDYDYTDRTSTITLLKKLVTDDV